MLGGLDARGSHTGFVAHTWGEGKGMGQFILFSF